MLIRKNLPIINIEIGSKYLKLFILEENKGQYLVKDYTITDISTYIANYSVVDKDSVTSLIKKFLVDNAVGYCKAYVSISSTHMTSSIVRAFTMDTLSKKEMESAMELQIASKIPFDRKEYEYTYSSNAVTDNDKISNVLLASIGKELLENYKLLFKDLKVLPYIQSKTANIINCIKPDENAMIVDIGHKNTEIIYSNKGQVLKSDSVNNIGGHNLTESISHEFGITYPEAEELKHKSGIIFVNDEVAEIGSEDEKKISDSVTPILDDLCLNIDRAIASVDRTANACPDVVYITGGSSKLRLINEFISSRINLETKTLKPFFLEDNPNEDIQSDLNFLATVAGSAIQEHEKALYDLTFFKGQKEKKDLTTPLVATLAAIFLASFIGTNTYVDKQVSLINHDMKVVEEDISKANSSLSSFQSEKNSLQNQINSLNNQISTNEALGADTDIIKDQKIEYADYLKELRNRIPTSIQINTQEYTEKDLHIEGYAPTYAELGFFIKELENSDMFEDLTFTYNEVNTNADTQDFVMSVLQYEIDMRLK